MTTSSDCQSYLFLMGSLSDATILDSVIAAKELEFQKLGVLTYLGKLGGSPEEFCNRLQTESDVYCEVHWMKLPSPGDVNVTAPAPALEKKEEEATAPASPAYFLVNN